MKLLYKITLVLILIFSLNSCEELSDLNIDPSKSAVASKPQLLTSAQGFIAYC